MLRTWIALECDDCNAQHPRHASGVTAPVDGAFESPATLRADAKQLGWQRYGGQDFCPECEKKHRVRALHSPGDSDSPAKKGGK
jgi:hypothetical protein